LPFFRRQAENCVLQLFHAHCPALYQNPSALANEKLPALAAVKARKNLRFKPICLCRVFRSNHLIG
jgi:hypothetical protein